VPRKSSLPDNAGLKACSSTMMDAEILIHHGMNILR
jgi:hypothetical protein